MTEKLPQDVADWLRQEYENETYMEGDITAKDAAAVWGVSPNVARSRLRQMVTDGKLTEHRGKMPSGMVGVFFRRVKQKTSV